MFKIRNLLFMVVALCALPMMTHAQDGGYLVREHDWRLTIGSNSFGLSQTAWALSGKVTGDRTTTIYFGRYTANTHIPAAYVAVMLLLPVAFICWFLLSGSWRKKRES